MINKSKNKYIVVKIWYKKCNKVIIVLKVCNVSIKIVIKLWNSVFK